MGWHGLPVQSALGIAHVDVIEAHCYRADKRSD